MLPGLDVLLSAARGEDSLPKLPAVVPENPWDLDRSTLRFMIEAASLLSCGELNVVVCVAGPLNPLVLIVGSTRMT